MRAVRATGGSLACLVAGVLLAAPAGAAIQTSSNSAPVLAGRTVSVEAACPTGTVPVSAGFASSFFNFLQGGVVPVGSARLANGSRAVGTNSGGPPRTLYDYAYCDTKPRAVVTRSSPVLQLPPGSRRTATASCPAATVPISGGYRFRNGSSGGGTAIESRRVRGGWEVFGYNGAGGPSAFRAVVQCQKGGAPLEGQSSKQTLGTFDTGSAETPCPVGTRIVSGGFNGHLKTLNTSLRVALPFASRRVQNAWRVTATSADSPTAVLTTFAYCEAG